MLQLRCAVAPTTVRRALRWERGFETLLKFRAREGHCCPERQHLEDNFRLGDWVALQRYRKDLLPVARKRRLDAIGFVWGRLDYLWERNFTALVNFKRREGHCCVPTHYVVGDLKLGWWVATQRRNKKIMPAERRKRLNKIGFVWTMGVMGPNTYQRFIRKIAQSIPRTSGGALR